MIAVWQETVTCFPVSCYQGQYQEWELALVVGGRIWTLSRGSAFEPEWEQKRADAKARIERIWTASHPDVVPHEATQTQKGDLQ